MIDKVIDVDSSESQSIVIVGAAAMPEEAIKWLRSYRSERPASFQANPGLVSEPFAIWLAKPSKGGRAQWDRTSSETGLDPITAVSRAAFVGAGDQVHPALILWSYLAKSPPPDPTDSSNSILPDATLTDDDCLDGQLFNAAVNWMQTRYAEMLQVLIGVENQRVNSGMRFAESVKAVRETIAHHESKVSKIIAEANGLRAEMMRSSEQP